MDHHKTAEAELAGLDFCEFDLNRSGGRLAWERFIDPQPPWLITYTEDRDLWRWALPQSREINAALRTLPLDFAGWDALHTDPDAAERLAVEGAAILRAEQVLIHALRSLWRWRSRTRPAQNAGVKSSWCWRWSMTILPTDHADLAAKPFPPLEFQPEPPWAHVAEPQAVIWQFNRIEAEATVPLFTFTPATPTVPPSEANP